MDDPHCVYSTGYSVIKNSHKQTNEWSVSVSASGVDDPWNGPEKSLPGPGAEKSEVVTQPPGWAGGFVQACSCIRST